VSTITSPSNPTLDYTALRPGEDPNRPLLLGLTAAAWVKIAIVSALLVALFRFNLARLWSKTNPISGDANWGHTTIIPIIGLYYLYLNRDRLLAAKVKPIFFERISRIRLIVSGVAVLLGAATYFGARAVWGTGGLQVGTFIQWFGMGGMALGVLMLLLGWGLGNLLFGLLVFAFGIYPGQNDWVSDYGMVHTIFGTVLTLCGWEVMAVVWFPIAFLVCGLPWPGLVYSWLASPLQHLAATVAVKALNLTGITAAREGTKMYIMSGNGFMRPLNVAEACAGLRSLMTFISVAAAVAFLSQRALWQKVVITLSAIPIAIFCNVMRVTGQAYLDRLAGPQWSENFAHQFVGLVMLIPAFFLILLVAWVIDRVFIEEVDDKTRYRAAAAVAKGGAIAGTTSTNKKVIVIPPKSAKPAEPEKPAPAVAKTQPAPKTAPPPKAAPAAKAPAPTAAPVRLPPRTNLTGNVTRNPTNTTPINTTKPNRPAEGA
jgi:exosortase